MNKPKVNEAANGYTLEWQEGVTIEVSRIKDYRDDIYSEITVSSSQADPPALGATYKYYLLSQSGREKMSKMLTARLNTVRWAEVLEQLSNEVVSRFRAGEPLIKVLSSDNYLPTKYLLDPIIPEGMPTVIFGEPESGKSQLAVIVAYAVALPWEHNTLGWKTRDTPANVLFLDWEAGPSDLGYRSKCFMTGMSLPNIEFNYLGCSRPLVDMIEEVKEKVEKEKIQLIIIDSLGYACSGDINKADPATSLWRALRKIPNVTTLAIAHTQKGEGKRTVFGSQFFEAGGRQIWELRRDEESDEKELILGLFHNKSNISGRRQPMGYILSYGEDSLSIRKHDLKQTTLVKSLPTRQQIERILLNDGAKTTKEIVEELGKPRTNIDVALKRMKDTGIVRKKEDETWEFIL